MCARSARGTAPQAGRLERDLPMKFVLIGSVVIVAMIWALLTFKPIPGASTGLFSNLVAALFVMVFGFLFVTVSSPHLRADRDVLESGERHDDRDADGHLRDVPGDGLDRRRIRGARDYDRRRGGHRRGQCRRDFAGLEDGLSGGRDARAAADRVDRRRAGGVVRHRPHAHRHEQRASKNIRPT